MYTLFLQKKKGDRSPFPLTNNLYDFLKCTKANGVFICPGHLSRNPGQVKTLLDDLLSVHSVQTIGIGNKYSSKSLHLYEDHIRRAGKLWEVDRNERGDHRKMVFIFRHSNPLPVLERKNLNAILNQIEIIAVAIGSSNFSYPTYGPAAPGALGADKGEADILMFQDTDSGIHDYMRQLWKELDAPEGQSSPHRMVLSESISPVPADFFRRMFKETLDMTLK